MIDDSASDYYQDKAELAKQAAEENARECIINGVHPKSGEPLSIEQHKQQLDSIDATDEERHAYDSRVAEAETQLREKNAEIEARINSQYPCSCCDARVGTGWSDTPTERPLPHSLSMH
jgi:hypothetical protein